VGGRWRRRRATARCVSHFISVFFRLIRIGLQYSRPDRSSIPTGGGVLQLRLRRRPGLRRLALLLQGLAPTAKRVRSCVWSWEWHKLPRSLKTGIPNINHIGSQPTFQTKMSVVSKQNWHGFKPRYGTVPRMYVGAMLSLHTAVPLLSSCEKYPLAHHVRSILLAAWLLKV
jgi:hypothetical protein